MKHKIRSFLCTVLVLLLGSSAVSVSGTTKRDGDFEYTGIKAGVKLYHTQDEYLSMMEKAAEDEKAILYFDKDTANIALYHKEDSSVWFSAPILNKNFNTAIPEQQQLMMSPIIIRYTDEKLQSHTLNSFADAASYGQLACKKTDNGVSFKMTIGKLAENDIVPIVLTQKRMEYLENQLEKDEYRYVKQSYRKIERKDSDKDKTLLTDYPGLSDGTVYVIRSKTGESIKKKLAEYFAKAKYTVDMLKEDEHAVYGKVKNKLKDHANFTLSVHYTLDKGQLVVSLSMDDIVYDEKAYKLNDVEILKYFGAADINDNGFFLLPDGSGAISEYSAGVVENGSPFVKELYGKDAVYQYDPSQEFVENGLVPMFGQQKNGSGFIAVMESGDAQSAVRSIIDEGENMMRYTHFICHSRISEKYVHNENASHDTYVKSTVEPYTGEFKIRYMPIVKSSYSDMAKYYRQYLIDNGKLNNEIQNDNKVHIDILGAVEAEYSGLIKNSKTFPLTTFDEASKIIKELTDANVKLDVKLSGWANGGLDYSVFNKIKLVKELGSKKDFIELLDTAEKTAVSVYSFVDLSYAYKNTLFDGFIPAFHASHQLDSSYGRRFEYNLGSSLGRYDNIIYVVNSKAMVKYNHKFLKKYDAFSAGIAYAGLAENLNSDSSKKSGSRTDAIDDYIKIMDTASQNHALEFEGGNQYVWKCASSLTNIPQESSNFLNTSYSVPFVQMVLHGKISYSSDPLNLADDYTDTMLKAIENGERLSYALAYKNIDKLTKSSHTEYRSIDYGYWKDIIVENAKNYHNVLKGTYNKQIVAHERMNENVAKVTYENGTEIVVNYSDSPFEYSGKKVAARSATAFYN